MLPDGFIDRCKEADKAVISTPFIDKMGECSCAKDKKDSDDRKDVQLFHAVYLIPASMSAADASRKE